MSFLNNLLELERNMLLYFFCITFNGLLSIFVRLDQLVLETFLEVHFTRVSTFLKVMPMILSPTTSVVAVTLSGNNFASRLLCGSSFLHLSAPKRVTPYSIECELSRNGVSFACVKLAHISVMSVVIQSKSLRALLKRSSILWKSSCP